MKVPRALLIIAALLVWLGFALQSGYANADDFTADVMQVKAAYLFKFGSYVQWPPEVFADEHSPLVIGVLADDVLADELVRVAMGRQIDKRPVSVKRMQPGDSVNGVHILFISQQAGPPAAHLLLVAEGQPVLCVTEDAHGLPRGSVINFVLDSNRLRFDVSLLAAERNRLQLSASLLAVARKVQKDDIE
ncbi:MAG TPA: YfiR family protein [Methylophilaceae bacterium]|nr:YfiR family protein [Methylophilaceae bacterium]